MKIIRKNRILFFVCVIVAIAVCACLASCNFGNGGGHKPEQEQNPCQLNGHTWINGDVIKEPTCNETGVMITYCGVCDAEQNKDIPALGHIEVTIDAVAPTCTEDGLSEGKYCQRCETVVAEQQTIAKLGHTLYDSYNFYEFPTEETAGIVCLYCQICNDEFEHELPVFGDSAYTVENDGVKLTYTIVIDGVEISMNKYLFEVKQYFSAYQIIGYKGTDANVVIPGEIDGVAVQAVAESAFADMDFIESVVVPDSVTYIGISAFQNCSALKSVKLPEGVTYIGASAFQNCTALTSVEIPEGVTEIGLSVFENCTALASVTISKSVETIGNWAFSNCTALARIDVPATVSTIGKSTFSGCTSLEVFNIAENSALDSVGEAAFFGCSALKALELPCLNVGYGALAGCTSLESLTVCNPYARNMSSKGLGSFFSYNSEYAFDNSSVPESLKTVVVTGECEIYSFIFRNCAHIEKITLDNTLSIKGESFGFGEYGVFDGCTSLKEVVIGKTQSISNAFIRNDALEKVTIGEATTIGERAFYQCNGLKEVTVGKMERIGTDAFIWCTKLETVSISDGLTAIGKNAFSNCHSLSTFTIPSTVETIEGNPFDACGDSLLTTEGGASYFGTKENPYMALVSVDVDGLTELVIHDGTKYVYNISISSCHSLVKLTIPTSVKVFANSETGSGWTLEEVVYKGTISEWLSIEFNYNPCAFFNSYIIGYTKVRFADGTTNVDVTHLVVPEGITELKDGVVSPFQNITSITLPASLKVSNVSYYEHLENVYYDGTLSDWLEIDFENSIASPMIRANNFYLSDGNGGYTEIVGILDLSDVTVETTHIYNLSGFDKVHTVIVPATLTQIRGTVSDVDNLIRTMYYLGSAEQWEDVDIHNHVTTSIIKNIYFYSETEPTEDAHLHWHYNADGQPELWVKLEPSVAGQYYAYSSTVITVTDQYWGMIQYLKEQGMLEEALEDDPIQIEMINSSQTKAEYEQKLSAFAALSGEGSVVYFTETEMVLTLNGQATATTNYVVRDGQIMFLVGSTYKTAYTIVEGADTIYEYAADEYTTTTHYWTLQQ